MIGNQLPITDYRLPFPSRFRHLQQRGQIQFRVVVWAADNDTRFWQRRISQERLCKLANGRYNLPMSKPYPIPAAETRVEIEVKKSRFIATAAPVFSVEEAKAFIARIKREFSDASHNVPAFLVGFGASVTAHCSDDGEPSGTAGRPLLTVLQGSGLGDIALVVTRYFGGTKLGTGGLVRAYTDAAKAVLAVLPRAEKVPTHTVLTAVPYPLLERVRLLVGQYDGCILKEAFAADITITAQFAVNHFPAFQEALRELSHDTLTAEIVETTAVIHHR